MARTYAYVETRVCEPIPEGEFDVETLTLIEPPEFCPHILYVVHPTTIDGDRRFLAQQAIKQRMKHALGLSNIIVIAPPQRCTYLPPGSRACTVRSDRWEASWVQTGEFGLLPSSRISDVTICGGNLERCLGLVVENVKRQCESQLSNDIPTRFVRLNIPLDAIFTQDGQTAQMRFLQFRQVGTSEVEALMAVLTNPGENKEHDKEWSLISRYDAHRYQFEIHLNGVLVAKLQPKTQEGSLDDGDLDTYSASASGRIAESVNTAWTGDDDSQQPLMFPRVTWVRTRKEDEPKVTFVLNVTYEESRVAEHEGTLPEASSFKYRLAYGREVMELFDVELVEEG